MRLVFLLWFAVVAFYLTGALSATRFQGVASVQPDTLLYCQAARRIVEGFPFSFSCGEVATTGTTTILYPFLLAIPYALGATGSDLIAAGFVLNSIFFLIFLLAWAKIFELIVPEDGTRLLATLMVALSGQVAFCALAQSDMGLWMAASSILLLGVVRKRRWLYGTMLVVGPWLRPEGIMCIIVFSTFVFVRAIVSRKIHRKDWLLLSVSVLSVLGVFALNYFLTGACQFSSVASKGYIKNNTLWEAIPYVAQDCLKIVRELALGMADTFPREFFAIPLIGGFLLILGAIVHDWSRDSSISLCACILVAAGDILVVSNSGWQNTNMDRYLVWLMPVAVLFIAEGCHIVNLRVNGCARIILPGLLIIYTISAAVVIGCKYRTAGVLTESNRKFAVECDGVMESSASVGTFCPCGLSYDFSDRRLRSLSGIYSPEFRQKSFFSRFEVLKNNKDARFDYWIVESDTLPWMSEETRRKLIGDTLLVGPKGIELRKANWQIYDNSSTNQCFIPHGQGLTCQVIVGDDESEKKYGYEVIDRYGRTSSELFLECYEAGKDSVFESSRLVIGGVRMSVPLVPQKDVTLVVRAKMSVEGLGKIYKFAEKFGFNLEIDGVVVGLQHSKLQTDGFTDCSFTIPGSYIRNGTTCVGILGDHLSCRYWFYQ